jgi:hypothetical protein
VFPELLIAESIFVTMLDFVVKVSQTVSPGAVALSPTTLIFGLVQ